MARTDDTKPARGAPITIRRPLRRYIALPWRAAVALRRWLTYAWRARRADVVIALPHDVHEGMRTQLASMGLEHAIESDGTVDFARIGRVQAVSAERLRSVLSERGLRSCHDEEADE